MYKGQHKSPKIPRRRPAEAAPVANVSKLNFASRKPNRVTVNFRFETIRYL